MSLSSTSAVITYTGSFASLSSSRMAFARPSPSISGIHMSVSTTSNSGRSVRLSLSSASLPSIAVSISKLPSLFTSALRTERFILESSTSRSLGLAARSASTVWTGAAISWAASLGATCTPGMSM